MNSFSCIFMHFFLLLFWSSGWCTPREAWWRARTFVLASAVTWTSSRGFPLLTCLEGLRNQSLTLAGTVGRLIEIVMYWKSQQKCVMILHCVCLSSGVLKATEYRPRCLQVNMLMSDTRGSEDCLYLNVWVPHGRDGKYWEKPKESHLCEICPSAGSHSLCLLVSTGLPVMVWIYGGGFLAGGSMGANFLDNYLYDGQEVADRGDVIVVTLGYRVGTLGFLSTGDSNMPGRYSNWA